MNTYKIFLASSFELKADRDQFEIFINRKNKEWVNKGIFFELGIVTGKQPETFLGRSSRGALRPKPRLRLSKKYTQLFSAVCFVP